MSYLFLSCTEKKTDLAKIKQRVKDKNTRLYPHKDDVGNYRTAVIEKKDSGSYKRETMKFWGINLGMEKDGRLEKKQREN